jgi:hypothetical protein
VDDGSKKTVFGERGKEVGLQPTAQFGFAFFNLGPWSTEVITRKRHEKHHT